MRNWTKNALCAVFALSLVPSVAFADQGDLRPGTIAEDETPVVAMTEGKAPLDVAGMCWALAADRVATAASLLDAELSKTQKVLSYDPAAIAAIGCQEESGHTICCPSYACAYADAVLDGTVNDHEYYSCSCCTWTDWGGGASSFRSVGTDEELLREAYDEISSGRPTVVHVSWSGGEHWIALIGYENAADPDHLTLDNFIALDPWDGAQLNAGSKYELYGDGCEHVSER